MTSGAGLQGLDFPIFHQLFPVNLLPFRFLLRGVPGRLPIQIRNLVRVAKFRRRIPMAIQAERHAQRFRVINFIHLVDLPMAFNATDAAIHMH
jgi:hypothetical protein